MKHLFIPVLICTTLFVYSCANQGSPTGGPKDTIPPTLTESSPANQIINYQNRSFTFTFDEMITTEKLKQKLVITPLTENKYKVKPKKNSFTIEFEEAFDDSTTYTFNFADGVTDVTEKTSVENFSYAFSTGPFIDSIAVSGTVRDLYTNEFSEEILIALFDSTDSLNIFSGKPKYFAKTNEQGEYSINNIKNGQYKIYAFLDDNNNLKCEPADEPHGFKTGFIDLNQSKDSINLRIQLIDSSPFRFIRSKTTGRYFDVLYNKYVNNYEISVIDNTNLQIPSNNLIKENKTLRFYPDSKFKPNQDSLQIQVSAADSLGNTLTDTLFVKFAASKRKADEFTVTLQPKSNASINQQAKFTLSFNKPIQQLNYDSILIKYDTILIQNIPDTLLTWNNNRTKLTWQIELEPKFLKNYTDSLIAKLDTLLADSTTFDSLYVVQKNYLKKIRTNNVSISIGENSIISVDKDTSTFISQLYKFKSLDDAGSISGKCITDKTSYFVQLLDKKSNPVATQKNPTKYIFNYVKPSDYSIRVLIDANNDGVWSPGNIQTDQEPEPIWFWNQTTTIRNNFILENNDIEF